ncbi:Homeodomain-like protein [Lactarius hatsudake]|nr:Homeodomain-like protein [Lactarius hatsudake]KAH8977707.1 Homeodomain-like protein [Lactarius hatsudake]KAH9160203.1 Homeodomain-like protein [Lactarius sanguifluus]
MGRRFISQEIKEKAVQLSLRGVADATIRECLGISQCTLRRLRQKFRQTGEVVQFPVCSGRPRLLDGLDFIEGCIQRQPDMNLQELQTHLLEATGVHVSTVTVWRTMKRLGYTMKTVRHSCSYRYH